MAKRQYKKRTYKKKPGRAANYKAGLGQLASDVMQLKRLINVEIKNHDLNSSTTVPTTGTVIGLSAVAQGDGSTTRDGDSIKLLKNSLKFALTSNASTAYTTLVRVIIFRGKQENAVGYSLTDILETADILSPKSYTDRFRTKVLSDRTYTVRENEASAVYTTQRQYNSNIKLYGHTQFVAGSTSIENGGLYMLLLSNQPTNTPTFAYYNRLTFTDN